MVSKIKTTSTFLPVKTLIFVIIVSIISAILFKDFFQKHSLIRLFILYLHTIFSIFEKIRKLFINVAGNQRNMDRIFVGVNRNSFVLIFIDLMQLIPFDEFVFSGD